MAQHRMTITAGTRAPYRGERVHGCGSSETAEGRVYTFVYSAPQCDVSVTVSRAELIAMLSSTELRDRHMQALELARMNAPIPDQDRDDLARLGIKTSPPPPVSDVGTDTPS